MNRFVRRSTLILVMAAALAGTACAQEWYGDLDNEWGLFVSYWAPKSTDSAPGIGGKLAFGILPNTRLDFRATYYDKLAYDEGGIQADLREVPLEAGLQFFGGSDLIELFFGFGLGYYYTEGNIYLSNNQAVDAEFDSEIGYYGNAGFEITLTENVAQMGATKATLYFDVGYRSVELSSVTINNQTFASTDSVDLSGANASVGLVIHW